MFNVVQYSRIVVRFFRFQFFAVQHVEQDSPTSLIFLNFDVSSLEAVTVVRTACWWPFMVEGLFLLNSTRTPSSQFSFLVNDPDVFSHTKTQLLTSSRSRRIGDAKATVISYFALIFPYWGDSLLWDSKPILDRWARRVL